MRANSSPVALASSSGKSASGGRAGPGGSRLAQGRACKVLDPIAPPPPEALGWVTMDEFMNVYEGCGYDAACNHVPYAGAADWAYWEQEQGQGLSSSGNNRMTAANGATYAFSRRPLSRPYRPFIGRTLKGSKGSI